MNKRRLLFAKAVVDGHNLREAALAAGYAQRSANSTGSFLFRVPAVQERIAELTAAKRNPPRVISLRELGTDSEEQIKIRQVVNSAGQVCGVFVPTALLISNQAGA